MENASSFISGCKRLQILNTLTMSRFHFSLRRVVDGAGSVVKTLHLLEFFDTGFLLSHQEIFFWSRKAKIIFSIFFTPQRSSSISFLELPCLYQKEDHVPMQWWTLVGYLSHSQPTVLAHHHSPAVPGFCLGMQES